jgi:hypothetical protein
LGKEDRQREVGERSTEGGRREVPDGVEKVEFKPSHGRE